MATGPGKDQEDPVHVKQQRHSGDASASPNAAFTTGAPRAAPAVVACSPPPPSGVDQPGVGRISRIEASGSAAVEIDREGKNAALASSDGSRGSSFSADAAEAEDNAKAASPPPSPAPPPLERVDDQPGEGRIPGADRKGKNAAVLSPAFCSGGSAAETVSRKAGEEQVIRPHANEESFLNQFTSMMPLEDISANGDDVNFLNGKCKLGAKIPLMVFANKYKNNSTFMQKFMILNEKYCFVRRTDGDGSCFYRSFIFSYLEKAVAITDQTDRTNEAIRLRGRIEAAMQSCFLGFHTMTDAQFERAFSGSEFVIKLIEDGLSAGEFYERELAENITSRIMPLLRSLTEIELCTRESDYKCFLTEHDSIYQLCVEEVRPDVGEASHLPIMALVNALGIAVVLGTVDMTNGGVEMTLVPESGSVSPVVATVLYLPGHYDVLYAS